MKRHKQDPPARVEGGREDGGRGGEGERRWGTGRGLHWRIIYLGECQVVSAQQLITISGEEIGDH